MSTELEVRRVAWLVFVISVCLAVLSPNLARAQSPYSELTGIVIQIPLPKSDTPSGTDPLLKAGTLRKVGSLPKSLRPTRTASLPKIEYTSLPSDDRISDPANTGSLPNTRTLGTKSFPGFTSLVTKGAIALRTSTPTECLPSSLLQVVADVADKFGPVSLESTHRSSGRNSRVGGAPHSLHIACRAIDFRIKARSRGVMAYLSSRSDVGGLKMYRNGLIHIDNGQRRSW
jgi:hypothetical protein